MTKKKALTITSTDWHLKESTIDTVKDCVRQMIELAKLLHVDKVFMLGDVFTSRKAIPESVLNAFGDILDMFQDANIVLIAIAGNHDRINNNEPKSYLTPFKNHPYFHLIDILGGVKIDNVMFHMLPYFEGEIYEQYLSQIFLGLDINQKNVLLTHQALNGATNNDGTKVENNLTADKFKQFDKVFCGHYHNRKDEYIGSLYQANYGEDNQKGFTVVYSDLSTELVKAKFKEYEKVVVEADLFTKDKLNKLIKKYENSENNVRFEFVGSDENITPVDVDLVKSKGIDVKIKRRDVEVSIDNAERGELIEFDNNSMLQEFDSFCEKEQIEDKDFGKKLLNQVL